MTTAKSRSRPRTAEARWGGGSGADGSGGGAAQPATMTATVSAQSHARQRATLRCGRCRAMFMALLECCSRLVERGVNLAELVRAFFGNAIVVPAFGELVQRIGEHVYGTAEAACEEIAAHRAGSAGDER